ncbi:coiled-coil domain-containing protein 66 isoform X2 [Dendropsophus ebraccatus]|uniref:coiled-coil domain-containing protein 66 isoform X2 n=1 Tax=Dendropsophus ebraccatus TaxID=150705 RepID=UPI003831B768
MNLGDGLMLETQILNGKPKLILAPYGVQEKTAKQVGNKGRAQKTTLKGKTPAQVLHVVHNNNAKPEQSVLKGRSAVGAVPPGKPPANVLKELENKHHDQNVQQTKLDAGRGKLVPKKTSHVPKQRLQQKPAVSAEELRESLVCLTQEQFQQILLTINHSSKPVTTDQTADKVEEKLDIKGESVAENPATEEEETESRLAEKNDPLTNELTNDGLFSTLGERERDKSLQEAKKAQWRRELDEQVALKKKLKEAEKDGINLRYREGYGRDSSVSQRTASSELPKNTPINDYSTPDQDDVMLKLSTGTETNESSPFGRVSSFGSPELPAAIRSAFVVGEAAPLDHPFSAVKRQQQKKWLEELNKQREEAAKRKMEEKQKLQESVQQDHWAMHFDSFKKQNPISQNTVTFQQFETPRATSDPLVSTPSPSARHSQQEHIETRKSTEEDHFQSQKPGFLRTMTSLLDPVQIEERDRKRLKQLEHQKAIEAQVEEKRRRKQLEEEQRQKEEQEEERRLAREREQMRQQYEEDSSKQKHKEEVLDLKTKELYYSMQRAQEEAQRLKHEQRMRHLLQKGHDISNLQKNVAGDTARPEISRAASRTNDAPSDDTNIVMKQSTFTVTSPRRDMAVQTDDLSVVSNPDSISYYKETTWRHEHNASPDIPIEFKDQQRKAEVQTKMSHVQRDRNDSSKENTNTYNDVYDQFARTEKQGKEHGRKPDWNKNKPQKKYIPASERYPRGLQKQREESKVRRQMELLHLVEKNSSNNLHLRKGTSPEKSPVPQEEVKISAHHEDLTIQEAKKQDERVQKVESSFKRSDSPPVPAVKNRLHQAQKRSAVTPIPSVYNGNSVSVQRHVTPDLEKLESDRPPSSQFVPYVRTKEIYYLDPNAPMSRPSTHEPQHNLTGNDQECRQNFSSDHAKDPLLNPNVIRNKDRQQAILRGLSELRKGLLQKQRELETGLMPDV